MVGRLPAPRSGGKRQGAQSGQGASELGLPRPAPRQVQCQPSRRAGEPTGEGEESPPQGLGGYHLLTQTDARRPARQVVRHYLHSQPSGVGGETAGREMVETHAVLEVAYGIIDLGVAAMVGLQFQGVAVPVGDESVIAVVGEERQLGAGRGFHPTDDESHRHSVGLAPEGG